ncbi:hypothetical protein [Piscinibacter sakaiensis]|uniref:hypothetical protein n=1 Tax=Piscinibacter sakaiensis TaxID=1547922 RepID=UPI003AADFCB8
MIANPDASRDAHVNELHLLGVPPMTQYIGHVRRRVIGGDALPEGRLIDQWRAAARHYEEIAVREAGEAECATIEPIAADRQPHIDNITAAPDFEEGFGSIPVAFGMVELDRLVVFQQRVSLDHAARFSRAIAAADNDRAREDALFGICLPLEADPPPVVSCNAGSGKYVFQSDLADLRAFSPRLISDATARTLLTSNGHAQAGIAVPIGFGARHLNVVRLAGRMVLNNGYHRAYALREAGFTHVPCVIQAISHTSELAYAGGSSLIDNFDQLFEMPRPPLFRDFFDPQLTTRLKLQRTRKQVLISVSIETLRVPD